MFGSFSSGIPKDVLNSPFIKVYKGELPDEFKRTLQTLGSKSTSWNDWSAKTTTASPKIIIGNWEYTFIRNGELKAKFVNDESIQRFVLNYDTKPYDVIDKFMLTSYESLFADCNHLKSIRLENINNKYISRIAGMCYRCLELECFDFNDFIFDHVSSLANFFNDCPNLVSVDFGINNNWLNITDLDKMFYKCSSLKNIDMSHIKLFNQFNAKYMFGECYSLITANVRFKLNNYNHSQMYSDIFEGMFSNCDSLKHLSLPWLYYYGLYCGKLKPKKETSLYSSNKISGFDLIIACPRLETLDFGETLPGIFSSSLKNGNIKHVKTFYVNSERVDNENPQKIELGINRAEKSHGVVAVKKSARRVHRGWED